MPNPEPNEKFLPGSRQSAFRFLSPTVMAIALHLAVALPLAWRLNIWLDEAWTMETTGSGAAVAWREAVYVEHQAPLYFIFMAFWRALDDSLFFARLLSTICVVATIALIPAIVKRFAGSVENADIKTLTLWLPLVVALHPYTVWASTEARVYASIVLMSAALLLFWHDGYAAQASTENQRKGRWARVIYFFLAIAALYTNYYLGFLLFANACALVALKRWKACFIYVAHMAAAGLVFAPLVVVIKRQFDVNADYYRDPAPLLEGLKLVWNIFNYFLLPSAEWDAVARVRVWTARILACVLIYLIARNARRLEPKTLALGVITAVVGGFLMTAYFLLGLEYTQHRHAAVLFFPILLSMAVWLANLAGRRAFYVWLVLLAIFVPTRLIYDHAPLTKNGDWQRVSRYVEANEAENEPIAAFQLHDAIPLGAVYRGKNRILRAPKLDDWAAEDQEFSPRRWRKQIRVLVEQIPAGQERLWLITDGNCFDEKGSIECEPLENFVRENFTVEKSADFYKRRVRLLRRKN